MSKNQPENQTVEPLPAAKPTKQVEPHRQCPTCHGGMGGVGKAYSTHGMTTYYRCQSCGFTWSVTTKRESVVIQHQTKEIVTR